MCIGSIDLLFKMGRYQHDGLAQIHGLANGLESGSRDIARATAHVGKELAVADAVKCQRFVHLFHLFTVFPIPEKMQFLPWISGMFLRQLWKR